VPVGAQAVGQHVRVGPVRLVARCAVAFSQRFHRPARDDHDLQAGFEQRVDNWTIRALDRDAARSATLDTPAQLGEPFGAVVDVELDDRRALIIDDTHCVRVSRPVHTGVAGDGIIHVSLLAVAAVGMHPVVAGRVCRSLTDRRSGALSPIASRHVLGHRTSRNSCWRSSRKRTWRWPDGNQGCANSVTAVDTPMVDQ